MNLGTESRRLAAVAATILAGLCGTGPSAYAQSNSCASATAIGTGTFGGDTSAATNDGSASCGESGTSPDVWFRYTPSQDCVLQIDTCGSAYDTVLSVHSGCPGTAGNELACNDDSCALGSAVVLPGQANATYLIRVAGWQGATGAFTLNVACTAVLQGDDCGDAVAVEPGTVLGDTSIATNDGSASFDGGLPSPDVWYTFTSTEGGRLRLDTCGASWDTVLSIHSGCPGTTANQLACNDDSCATQSVLSQRVDPNVTYWIRVAGWQAANGPFALHVSISPNSPPGADILIGELTTLEQYGRLGDVVGCGLDSPVCNAGDEPLDWFGNPDPRHPFMVANVFRLWQGRFEQIGQSWVKHGFGAGQDNACGLGCDPHPDATRLGVGCSDTYSASLNAVQTLLGPRSEINPWTGAFTFEGSHLDTGQGGHDAVEHRLELRDGDIDPATHPGASYFCEMYVVAHDDVNHLSSVAWEPIEISGAPGGTWSFDVGASFTRVGPAIEAWTTATRTTIQQAPADDGRAILAVEASDNGDGTWHFEYALCNFDMDRQVGSLSIPMTPDVLITNIGFSAVPSHDEGYTNDPWSSTRDGQSLTWATVPFQTNPFSNPIRWGTTYSFRFDASAPPVSTTATLGLFKPGTPTSLTGVTQGPSPDPCRPGTVNTGAGAATDVLFVNGSAGSPGERIVTVNRGEPITVDLLAAPLGPSPARYAALAWRHAPTGSFDLIAQGHTLGCTVNPTPFNANQTPQPFRCLRGGLPPIVCGSVPELPAPSRAPFSISRPQGIAGAVTISLQGLLEDLGSSSSVDFSVTNAVILRVQ